MMGRQKVDQSQLFYLFNLEGRIPAHHLRRRINPMVTRILAGLGERLEAFYSEIDRPSIDPELMLRMLIVGYCYGLRSERVECASSVQSASRCVCGRAEIARRLRCRRRIGQRPVPVIHVVPAPGSTASNFCYAPVTG